MKSREFSWDRTNNSAKDLEGEIQNELERMEQEGGGCGRGCSCARSRAADAALKRLRETAAQQGS